VRYLTLKLPRVPRHSCRVRCPPPSARGWAPDAAQHSLEGLRDTGPTWRRPRGVGAELLGRRAGHRERKIGHREEDRALRSTGPTWQRPRKGWNRTPGEEGMAQREEDRAQRRGQGTEEHWAHLAEAEEGWNRTPGRRTRERRKQVQSDEG